MLHKGSFIKLITLNNKYRNIRGMYFQRTAHDSVVKLVLL